MTGEWVTGLTSGSGNFLNSTNNRLESFNSKLKSVIPVYSNLPEFFNTLADTQKYHFVLQPYFKMSLFHYCYSREISITAIAVMPLYA